MNPKNVNQFKLASGDEIICEVVEWDSEENEGLIVVRNIFSIHTVETKMTRMHALRPYMCFQMGSESFQTLSLDHITVQALPSLEMLKQYQSAVSQEETDTDKINRKIDDYINQMREAISSEEDLEIDENIIKFPNKDKLH